MALGRVRANGDVLEQRRIEKVKENEEDGAGHAAVRSAELTSDVIDAARQTILSHSHLLQLPTEIRLKILEYVLYNPKPLIPHPRPCAQCTRSVPRVALYTHLFEHKIQKKTLGVYPDILATCHQLHNEGTPLLYCNTAALIARLSPKEPPNQVFSIGHTNINVLQAEPGQTFILPRRPTPLSPSKLHVVVEVGDDPHESAVTLIATLADILKYSFVSLRELTVYLAVDSFLERPSSYMSRVLAGLECLHGIPSVKITGTAPVDIIARLEAQMMAPVDRQIRRREWADVREELLHSFGERSSVEE